MTLINTTPHETALKERVFRLLQEADELGGLDLDEYVRLMEEIAVECRERSLRARELAEATTTTHPRELEACEGGVKAFTEAFPEGLDVSRWDASCQLGVLMHPELRKYLGWAWENQVLPRLPMTGWNLSGATLNETDLSGASLYGASLSRADLRWAKLRGANLRWANLSGADLGSADLSRAIMYEANLSGANLSGADLTGANLRGADLRGANLCKANLSGADLSGADLRKTNLTGANLHGANLYAANLYRVDLSEVDLRGARWHFRDRPTDLNVNEEGKQER